MARRVVPIFPAMVVAIPIVIGIAAISTNRRAEMALDEASVAAASLSPSDLSILNGQEQSFLIVGGSTSIVWPSMLQDMLDEHCGTGRVYHVLNGSVPDASVASWIAEPGTPAHDSTVGALERDFLAEAARLLAGAPRPVVALCQQTLRDTRFEQGPVRDMYDIKGIMIGADSFHRLGATLKNEGIERVYLATQVFQPGAEPQVGNERLALAELLSRHVGYLQQGPDVWSATVESYPTAYADQANLNEEGCKIVAEAWYRVLAGSHARVDVIERMRRRSYDVDAITRRFLSYRRAG